MRTSTPSSRRSSSATTRPCAGRPVIVGSWVVMAASYEARAFGVGHGMGGASARRLCPDAVVVPPRWAAYVEASRAVFDVFSRTSRWSRACPSTRPSSTCGAWRAARARPTEIALRLRRQVREEVGLPITVGVATPRASPRWQRARQARRPDGGAGGCELALLHRLPVERLWGVGPATAARLHRHGLARVGQIAALGEPELVAPAGLRRRPQPPRAGPQPRPAARPGGARPADLRRAVGAGQPAAHARGARRGAARAGGPGDAPDAVVGARGADRGAAPALRRLLRRHPLAHAAPAHRRLGADAGRGARPVRRGAPGHRAGAA